jgi:hypothetical protein
MAITGDDGTEDFEEPLYFAGKVLDIINSEGMNPRCVA